MSELKTVTGARPVGNQILVEILTKQEALGTRLHVGDANETDPPQAYVVELGPQVVEAYGIKVNDRVILQGKYVPLPKSARTNPDRELGVVEPHCIKAILTES